MAQMRQIFYGRRKLAILLIARDRHNVAAGGARWTALAARFASPASSSRIRSRAKGEFRFNFGR
jgi:hypothetical protein